MKYTREHVQSPHPLEIVLKILDNLVNERGNIGILVKNGETKLYWFLGLTAEKTLSASTGGKTEQNVS